MEYSIDNTFLINSSLEPNYNGFSLIPNNDNIRVLNFSPGPTSLPTEVMTEFKNDFVNKWKLGASPLEISHRSPEFLETKISCEKLFREILEIPDNYELIWTHGGGHGQFSAVPINLTNDFNDKPNYIVTGTWSNRSFNEAKKFCSPNKSCQEEDISDINKIDSEFLSKSLNESKNSSYVYVCSNETINGLEFREDGIPIPSKDLTKGRIMIVDMSSDILSKKVNWDNIDVAFACAPKNFGFAGSTVTIIKKDLLDIESRDNIPSLLDWKLIRNSESFWNTLPVFNIYITERILRFYKKIGGIQVLENQNTIKSNIIYNILDDDNIYEPVVSKGRSERSRMNIPFYIKNKDVMELFVHNAFKNNIVGLKTKTPFTDPNKPEQLRISLYNSVTIEDTQYLASFMINFDKYIKSTKV